MVPPARMMMAATATNPSGEGRDGATPQSSLKCRWTPSINTVHLATTCCEPLLLVVPVALMLCTGLSTAAATTVGNVCEEDACEADTSMRVVEYFGADWCEPCRPVEAMLDALERPDVLVVRHAPSPQDTGFSNLSYQRFDAHYGLISLPAIVIDGYAVLTGETMALRLEEALNVTEGAGRT